MEFSACTRTEIVSIINDLVNDGEKIVDKAKEFSQTQLAYFIDQLFASGLPRATNTASTERAMSKSLACFLFELNRQGRPEHYSVIRDIINSRYEHMVNDYSTLKYWRLIEPVKGRRGYWQITERGKAFLNGKLKIAERLAIYNDRVIQGSKTVVSIDDFDVFDDIAYNGNGLIQITSTTI